MGECKNCNKENNCTNNEQCWCMGMPKNQPIPYEKTDCYCKSCLSEIITEKTKNINKNSNQLNN